MDTGGSLASLIATRGFSHTRLITMMLNYLHNNITKSHVLQNIRLSLSNQTKSAEPTTPKAQLLVLLPIPASVLKPKPWSKHQITHMVDLGPTFAPLIQTCVHSGACNQWVPSLASEFRITISASLGGECIWVVRTEQ